MPKIGDGAGDGNRTRVSNYTRMMRDPYSTQAGLLHANAIPKNLISGFWWVKNGADCRIDWVCQKVCKLRKIGY